MSKEIIKNAISVYIQEEKSDYAVMLNGAWGSGKTYFVKNELIDYLQEEFDRKILYISLFGISNIDELYNNIALQILNIKVTETLEEDIKSGYSSYTNPKKENAFERNAVTWWAGIINKGLKIIPNYDIVNSVISEISQSKINFDKYIFIFDDLERSTLDFNVLLGFFDQIVDQNGAKAILICNENEINGKHYKKFKEKVIGLTIDYKSDINNEFPKIVDLYLNNPECKKYLVEYSENILYLFNVSNTSNFRTLIFILKRFEEMYNKLYEIYLEFDNEKLYFDKFMKEILLGSVGSSILIKEKHKNNNFKEEKRIISNFEKESDLKGKYIAYKFIDNYLIEYNFNENEAIDMIIEFINSEKYDINKVMSKISIILSEDNDEIAVSKFEEILQLIENNELNINIYPKILDEIFILLKIFFNNNRLENIKRIIKENAKKRVKEFSSFSWSTFPYNDHEANEFKEEIFCLLKKEEKDSLYAEWINIFEDNNDFIGKLDSYVLKNYEIFRQGNIKLSEIGVNKVFECIKKLNIKDLRIFRGDLEYVFGENNSNSKNFNIDDKELCKELKEKIELRLLVGNKKSKLQKLELKYLCDYLEEKCTIL